MSSKALIIGIHGSNGKMGKAILDAYAEERQGKENPGLEIGYLYSRNSIFNDLDQLFVSCDVVIDFSSPDCIQDLLAKALKYNKKLVIGTTGLSPNVLKQMQKAAEEIAIFYSSNMSVGVNLLAKILKLAAKTLNAQNYDVDIIDIHHKHKKDAPSGTALMLGGQIAQARGANFEDAKVINRIEKGSKKMGEIDFCSLRSGSEPGLHEIIFSGEYETISFKHKSHSRKLFASEVLKISKWISSMPEGFYSMDEYTNNI